MESKIILQALLDAVRLLSKDVGSMGETIIIKLSVMNV